MEEFMKKVLVASIALVGFTAAASAAVVPWPVRVGDVSVTVTYTGKGNVDDTHEILVFLFDHPTPTPGSEPLAMQMTTKSGGTVTFKDVAQDTVYVTLVYDEQANYDGKSGPPPAGAPIGSYMKDGKAIPVKPGPAAKLKVSFDDSVRWK
jgi:type 1 fimbria pilin